MWAFNMWLKSVCVCVCVCVCRWHMYFKSGIYSECVRLYVHVCVMTCLYELCEH